MSRGHRGPLLSRRVLSVLRVPPSSEWLTLLAQRRSKGGRRVKQPSWRNPTRDLHFARTGHPSAARERGKYSLVERHAASQRKLGPGQPRQQGGGSSKPSRSLVLASGSGVPVRASVRGVQTTRRWDAFLGTGASSRAVVGSVTAEGCQVRGL